MIIGRFISNTSLAMVLSVGSFGLAPGQAAADQPSAQAVFSTHEQLAAVVGEPMLQVPPLRLVSGTAHTFSRRGATFIVVHLASVRLRSGDRLMIRKSGDTFEDAQVKLDENGQATLPVISGDSVDVLLSCSSGDCEVVVDLFVRGLNSDERDERSIIGEFVQTCGDLDLEDAVCYKTDQPSVYEHSRAVARLIRGGEISCSGWLLGSEGHLMTNYHCIKSKPEATATLFEFVAESDACDASCDEWGACPGRLRINGAKFIWADPELDYALVQLPVELVSGLGYLKIRTGLKSPPERIYIPQHPAAQGKKIAFRSSAPEDNTGTNAGYPKVMSSRIRSCLDATTVESVGYYADTDYGSSGSPVIALSDHRVIALHQCPGCPNTAIPMADIVAHMEKLNIVPPNSVEP